MGKFKWDDDAVEDHGRAKASAYAKEEHSTTLITAESLHGSVVDESKGLAEGLLIGEVDPSRGEVMRLCEGMIVDDGAGIAYGNAVVVPVRRSGEDIFGHLFSRHGGAGRNLDRDADVARGNLDVGTTDVDHKNFHDELDGSSERESCLCC